MITRWQWVLAVAVEGWTVQVIDYKSNCGIVQFNFLVKKHLRTLNPPIHCQEAQYTS